MGRGISMMECQCGHTFPEQRQVTQLVKNNSKQSQRNEFYGVIMSK